MTKLFWLIELGIVLIVSATVSIATTYLYLHFPTKRKVANESDEDAALPPDVVRSIEIEPDFTYESVEEREWKVEQEILTKMQRKELTS
jgi:hypothetical protein